MSETADDILQIDYQAILDTLQELDSCLIILDHPRIALPASAWRIVGELECACSASALPQPDKKSVLAYVESVKMFCCTYFEKDDSATFPEICLLRLPSDSRELLNAYNSLYQQSMVLHTKLKRGLMKLQATLPVN